MLKYQIHSSAEEVLNKRKRTLGSPWCRWENNIKRVVEETGCEGVEWINLAHDRNRRGDLVNTVIRDVTA
jgi:hypothetical protein